MPTFLYLDTETLGLDMERHDIWEVAFAIDGPSGEGEIRSLLLPHSIVQLDRIATEVNDYHRRWHERLQVSLLDSIAAEKDLADTLGLLGDYTVVGANPAFDTYRLMKRWGGYNPWKHRLLDISVYAMPWMALQEPASLLDVSSALHAAGYDIPRPDHSASGDVECVRACHRALQEIYGEPHG